MKFEELKQIDKFHAFSEFNTVSHDKECGVIPHSFFNSFKDTCVCGSDRIISLNSKGLMCCDPRCKEKIIYALAYTFDKFKVKELGVERCRNIVSCIWDDLELKSHVEIIKRSNERCFYNLSSSVLNNFIDACNKIKMSKITLANLVSNLGFPSLGSNVCDKLLNVRSSMDLLDEMSKSGGVLNYCVNHGVYDSSAMFYLKYFLPDIGLAESILVKGMDRVALRRVPIVITGTVYPNGDRMTRDQFIQYMNIICTLSNGVRVYEFYSSKALSSCDNVIADSQSSSEKYLYGIQNGILCTSTEYVTKYKNYIKQLEDDLKEGNS